LDGAFPSANKERDTKMQSILGLFRFGEIGFFLLVLALISVIVFYILFRKQQQ
jgi:hypothetical protein